jgi:hypothetical protein
MTQQSEIFDKQIDGGDEKSAAVKKENTQGSKPRRSERIDLCEDEPGLSQELQAGESSFNCSCFLASGLRLFQFLANVKLFIVNRLLEAKP